MQVIRKIKKEIISVAADLFEGEELQPNVLKQVAEILAPALVQVDPNSAFFKDVLYTISYTGKVKNPVFNKRDIVDKVDLGVFREALEEAIQVEKQKLLEEWMGKYEQWQDFRKLVDVAEESIERIDQAITAALLDVFEHEHTQLLELFQQNKFDEDALIELMLGFKQHQIIPAVRQFIRNSLYEELRTKQYQEEYEEPPPPFVLDTRDTS